MTTATILLVDDDAELTAMLCRYLEENGLQAQAVHDSSGLDNYLTTQQPDLLVLDVMLPNEDGLSILRRIKAQFDFPVLMLSAKGDDVDRIVGLEIGADDYVSKPFNPRELLARIRARLRRPSVTDSVNSPSVQVIGDFTLDTARQTVRRGGEILSLSTAEYALLRTFLNYANRVLSRSQLVDLAQDVDRLPYERSIDVRVTRLRKKIEVDHRQPRYLRTVWGAGYLFVPDGQDEA